MEQISVLIIDNSKLACQTLERILTYDTGWSIVRKASEPIIAEHLIKIEMPDVVIIDVEMPGMDGVRFLKKLLEDYKVPIIVCSRIINIDFENNYHALNICKLKVIQKPMLNTRSFLEDNAVKIRSIVKEAVLFNNLL